jgi:acyl-CoA synthetase (NDP forming)
MIDTRAAGDVLSGAFQRGTDALLETEGLRLVAAMGIKVPRHLLVRDSGEVAETGMLGSERVVVKVVSPEILHKSDVGGVAVVVNEAGAVREAIQAMEKRLGAFPIACFTVNEFIDYDRSPGSELLLGLRWTDDFGPVVSFGAGGIYAEFLASSFKEGCDVAIFSHAVSGRDDVRARLARVTVGGLAAGELRGQKPRIDFESLVAPIERFFELGRTFMPEPLLECEINPLVITPSGLVALDILAKLRRQAPPLAALPRPIAKIGRLLRPRSAVVIGVSERLNPGRMIVNNLLRRGFDREKLFIVKPGTEEIDGCRCFPDIGSVPGTPDMIVLSIDAAQASAAVVEIIEKRKGESIVLIPGGLEEKAGSERIVVRMREALAASRASEWGGPVINGGNCLGIRSLPGRYDTTFIPEHKLPVPAGDPSPIAIISQSGAFAVAQASKLPGVNPRYSITLGNQMDLTVGDYLTYLKDEQDVELFAVYVEGFRPLDGLRFLEAADEITRSGRNVLLYRAGRTSAGREASASHTASIAGDYAVTRELAAAAGVIVVEDLSAFEALVRLFSLLRKKRVSGRRLGAVSNAGFECVAIGDNIGRFTLASFEPTTEDRLRSVFSRARIDSVVDLHNPLDLTPMTGDLAYEEVVRAIVEDEGVDVAVVGCVPLTAALNTLEPGDGHAEDLRRDDSVVSRMARLHRESVKAWVVVVDAGPRYDPMAHALEASGVPTFRSADRALAMFNIYCDARLRLGQVERV